MLRKTFGLLLLMLILVGCYDNPGSETYFRGLKQYASDYIKSDTTYSKFVAILERATGPDNKLRLMDLLSTYGEFTVFAPTNKAIDDYLAMKGVRSVGELSKADCDTLALNHIIEQSFFTTDYNNGTYPQSNMLGRYLTITCDSDTISVPGKVNLEICINQRSRLIHYDDSVKNGVVHTLRDVITSRNDMLPSVLADDSEISIFYSALHMTKMDEKMLRYIDESYSVGADSIDWTNDKLVMSTASEYDNVAYMKQRLFKYSAFVEKDEVYRRIFNDESWFSERGISSPDYASCKTPLDSLCAVAKVLYDPVYPEDANVSDPADRRNSLNRFVSYHLLPFQQTYYQWTCVDGSNSTLATNWTRRKIDIADWYETMMPHSLLKCSFPSGPEVGLYINRRGRMQFPDYLGFKIRGAKVATPDQMPDNIALNGVYYYIDDIIAYDRKTQNDVIGGERLRIDSSTLSPDFMTSGARGHYTKSGNENGKYGTWDATPNHENKNTGLGFKAGSAENFIFSDNTTHIHVRPRSIAMWCYQGDELTIIGQFDIAFKLPPVPEGTWELRLFACFGFTNRGIVQFYFGEGKEVGGKLVGNLQPCGIPLDLRPDGSNPRINWIADASLGDDESIATFDKAFHNRGWMKGFGAYGSAATESNGGGTTIFRNFNKTLRKVITQFYSDGKSDYWLRMQQKLESAVNAMPFDGIELCPKSIYNNEYYSEDKN